MKIGEHIYLKAEVSELLSLLGCSSYDDPRIEDKYNDKITFIDYDRDFFFEFLEDSFEYTIGRDDFSHCYEDKSEYENWKEEMIKTLEEIKSSEYFLKNEKKKDLFDPILFLLKGEKQ